MRDTTTARPFLLNVIALANILIGALGSLVLGFNLVGLVGIILGGSAGLFAFFGLLAAGGTFLITLTMLRWGWAVVNDQPTMAYLPGRAARVGNYGIVTGALILTLTIPIGFLVFVVGLLVAGILFEDPVSGGVGRYDFIPIVTLLAYALLIAISLGMIVYSRRLNLAAVERSGAGEEGAR